MALLDRPEEKVEKFSKLSSQLFHTAPSIGLFLKIDWSDRVDRVIPVLIVVDNE